uniref:Uncharacterized protein n=2 Tax=viral metagenome TaxID=1070528 RepID=A0A6M3LBT4_9ZZZZ
MDKLLIEKVERLREWAAKQHGGSYGGIEHDAPGAADDVEAVCDALVRAQQVQVCRDKAKLWRQPLAEAAEACAEAIERGEGRQHGRINLCLDRVLVDAGGARGRDVPRLVYRKASGGAPITERDVAAAVERLRACSENRDDDPESLYSHSGAVNLDDLDAVCDALAQAQQEIAALKLMNDAAYSEAQLRVELELTEKDDEITRLRVQVKNVSSMARQENAWLRKWINDLQSGLYINCVYCGHRYGPNSEVPASMADVLKVHIERCPEHPMSSLRQENARLKLALTEATEQVIEADESGKVHAPTNYQALAATLARALERQAKRHGEVEPTLADPRVQVLLKGHMSPEF